LQGLLQGALEQIIALAVFFLSPAIQYVLLKNFSKNEGKPQLWYLPRYGFRLVIRNLPGKRILSDLKYRTVLRLTIPRSEGSSVATYQDYTLVEQDDFFLFPGNDQVLLTFRLEGAQEDNIDFILTNKLGKEKKRISLSKFDRIISCYTANVENILNLDIKIGKQAEIKTTSLIRIWKSIQEEDVESRFEIDRIRDVG